ncbi:MAG: flagellar export chaperone FlgN [Oceanidesulfovibrio sp.]
MYRSIIENLQRQDKAFILLDLLLEEEYSQLKNRAPERVTQIEMQVHELVRQITDERQAVRAMAPGRLASLIAELPEGLIASDMVEDIEHVVGLDETEKRMPLAELLNTLLKSVDDKEQKTMRQAEKNAEFALALMDQNSAMAEFLYSQITPEQKKETYSAKGRYKASKREASMLNGRL